MVLAAVIVLVVNVVTLTESFDLSREYYANHSLVGASIACSKDEWSCLSLNLLFHPPSNKCLRFGFEKETCVYAADRCTYEGSERLVATCHFRKQCPSAGGASLPMAWDGRCAATGARCPCGDGGGPKLPPSVRPPGLHLFGGAQCACAEDHAAATRSHKYVLQPQHKGRCLVPDFVSNPHQKLASNRFPFKIKCPEQWKKCNITNNEVWLKDEGCVALFAEDVCAEGFSPMLAAPEKGRLQRSLAPARVRCIGANRFCGPSEVRMALDRRCHDRDLFEKAAVLQRDAFGFYHLQMRRTAWPSAQLVDCVEYEEASSSAMRLRRNPKSRRRGKGNERRRRRRRRNQRRMKRINVTPPKEREIKTNQEERKTQ